MTATSDPRIDALLALAYAAAKENAEYWYGDVNGPAKRWVESDSYAALKTALEAAVLEPLSVPPALPPLTLPLDVRCVRAWRDWSLSIGSDPESAVHPHFYRGFYAASPSLPPSSGETQASGA